MTVFLERFARRGFDPSLFSPKYDNEGSKRILHYHTLAEREGFEPSWERLTPIRFRVDAVMATSVPLHSKTKLYRSPAF